MIRLYYMKLDGDCSDEQSLALYKMLPKERKESVDRTKNQEIARKRLYTGAFMQYVLSKETGLLGEQLHYEYNQWGKPELKNIQNIHFNLSHSGKYVVLAVSDGPVGIDVEHKTRGYASLSKRFFCEEEYNDIISAPLEMERERLFLECWTKKEAYIKCVGKGMQIPLNSFQIQKGEHGVSCVLDENHFFRTIFLDEEYCMSVCGLSQIDVEACVDTKNLLIEICISEIWKEK